MKHLAIAFSALLLVACGKSGEQEQTAGTTVTLLSTDEYIMLYPDTPNVPDEWFDRLSLLDIIIVDENKKSDYCNLIAEYRFKDVLDNPASFSDIYADSFFVDGIEIDMMPGDVGRVDAQKNTKVLPQHYANIATGFLVKRDDISENKEFNLLVYCGEHKVYDFYGHLGDLPLYSG